MSTDWKPTACILCECNCGLEVQLGGEGGTHFTKINGGKFTLGAAPGNTGKSSFSH